MQSSDEETVIVENTNTHEVQTSFQPEVESKDTIQVQ